MTEFIGARISLISKSDIRYVGTLVEINSADSTVALENVRSYGTEDRRKGDEFFPPSQSTYDYILFRGSDVKDLRVESRPNETPQPQEPPMPADPAILGSARPGGKAPTPSQQPQQPGPPPPGPQYNQFAQFGGPPPPNFGRGGFPGPFPGQPPIGPYHGGPGMPFPHGPPGPHNNWYGGLPPGGFPPNQFGHGPPPGMPMGPPATQSPGPPKNDKPVEKDTDVKAPEPPKPTIPTGPKKAPPPPVESKPDVAAALAPPAPTEPKSFAAAAASTTQSKGRAPATPAAPAARGPAPPKQRESQKATSNQTPAELAAAAVAAAMAKLPGVNAKPPQMPASQRAAGDNLSQKLNEMRIDDTDRHQGQSLRGGAPRGRGRGRGAARGVVIPKTDFDFDAANKKFNKEDLAKEADVTDTVGNDADDEADGDDEVVIPNAPGVYDKKRSFFDDISSELKDRDTKKTVGGQEFRSEERKKNFETFGQGSIDGGYRGRGRGGRGGRGRGRGGPGSGFGMTRGRGGFSGSGGTAVNQSFAS